MDAETVLPLVWGVIIAFGVCMYVLMDGFDLGIGILFNAAPGDRERDLMMNSVAPIWDGNETWLVLGGAGLFAAFPLAYAVILPALYIPLTVMLIALIFRGVAFEFRFKATESRIWWDRAFHYGSLVATFAQGVVLGAYVQGFEVVGRRFVGGTWDWLTPFSLMTGVALIAGYALLGSTWLVLKTEGDLRHWAGQWSLRLVVAVAAFMALVSAWVPFLDTDIVERWFSLPNILFLWPVPAAVAALTILLYRSIWLGHDGWPFLLAMALFLLGFLGLGISLWPNVIPPDITLWQAASPPESQIFLLVGIAILVPVILFYTGYTYWIFRGKVEAKIGYH